MLLEQMAAVTLLAAMPVLCAEKSTLLDVVSEPLPHVNKWGWKMLLCLHGAKRWGRSEVKMFSFP